MGLDQVLRLFAKVVPVLAAAVFLLRIFGRTPPPSLVRMIAWLTAPTLAILAFVVIHANQDFDAFYDSGRDILAGRNPYEVTIPPWRTARMPALNPPTTLPLFVLLSIPPPDLAVSLWTLLNIAGLLGLVELARRALNASGGVCGREIRPADAAGLMAAVALSTGVREGLCWGQLHILEAYFLIGAILARGKSRPILAGVLMGLASIKPQTMMPFLLLFHRKSDRASWIAMIVTGLLLLVSTRPDQLLNYIQAWQVTVAREFKVGGINDYSYAVGSITYCLVSFSHVLYALGMRDRSLIASVQLGIVGVIGLAFVVDFWRRRNSRDASLVALLGCYSMLFIYHRTYDGAILALSLVYATARARETQPGNKLPFIIAAIAMWISMNPYSKFVGVIYDRSWNMGDWGQLIRIVSLPMSTWMMIVALLRLWIGVRRDRSLVAAN